MVAGGVLARAPTQDNGVLQKGFLYWKNKSPAVPSNYKPQIPGRQGGNVAGSETCKTVQGLCS